MHFTIRLVCIVLCLCIFTPLIFSAASITIIDTSYSSKGYFTVNYTDIEYPKMKISITYDNQTEYYDYTPRTLSSYAFTQGNGVYKIRLLGHVFGNKYKSLISIKVRVVLENALLPYLVSTEEIKFVDNDDVVNKACEICDDITNVADKVIALCEYVNTNISYDYNFVVPNKAYHPNASIILKNKKGICYDYAVLFAVMCRSQNIPCYIEKGYKKNVYHAWNKVYVNGMWYSVDLTIPKQNFNKIIIQGGIQ